MQDYIITLNESPDYLLRTEKTDGQWWLETIERATGNTRIIYCTTKKAAQTFFEGMSFVQINAFLDKMKVPTIKMYKEGI